MACLSVRGRGRLPHNAHTHTANSKTGASGSCWVPCDGPADRSFLGMHTRAHRRAVSALGPLCRRVRETARVSNVHCSCARARRTVRPQGAKGARLASSLAARTPRTRRNISLSAGDGWAPVFLGMNMCVYARSSVSSRARNLLCATYRQCMRIHDQLPKRTACNCQRLHAYAHDRRVPSTRRKPIRTTRRRRRPARTRFLLTLALESAVGAGQSSTHLHFLARTRHTCRHAGAAVA